MASSFPLHFAHWLIECDHFSSQLYWPKTHLNGWYHLWDLTTGYHSVNLDTVAHRRHGFSEGLRDIIGWDWKWSHSINHRAQRVGKLKLIMETWRLINCKSRWVECLLTFMFVNVLHYYCWRFIFCLCIPFLNHRKSSLQHGKSPTVLKGTGHSAAAEWINKWLHK